VKQIEVFSLSAIDLLCSAFGCAFILAFVFAVIPILQGHTEHGRTLVTVSVDQSQQAPALLGTYFVIDGIRYDPLIDDPQGRVTIRPASRFSPRYEIEFSNREFSEPDALVVYVAENDPPDPKQRARSRSAPVTVEITKVGPSDFSRRALEVGPWDNWASAAPMPSLAGPMSLDSVLWRPGVADGRHADASPNVEQFDELIRLFTQTNSGDIEALLHGRKYNVNNEAWAGITSFRYTDPARGALNVRMFFPRQDSARASHGEGPVLLMWRGQDGALPSGLVQFSAVGATSFLGRFEKQDPGDFSRLSIAPAYALLLAFIASNATAEGRFVAWTGSNPDQLLLLHARPDGEVAVLWADAPRSISRGDVYVESELLRTPPAANSVDAMIGVLAAGDRELIGVGREGAVFKGPNGYTVVWWSSAGSVASEELYSASMRADRSWAWLDLMRTPADAEGRIHLAWFLAVCSRDFWSEYYGVVQDPALWIGPAGQP
jgi:hypothetical protein